MPEMVERSRFCCWCSCGDGSVERQQRLELPGCVLGRVSPGSLSVS